MRRSNVEMKVGIFVFACLGIIALLLIQFSKGTTFLRKTYNITLHTANAGGLRPKAGVLLSGVQVGTVSTINLDTTGTNVDVLLKLYSDLQLKDDARFVIEASGFLGDQYVAIYPGENQGKPLPPGSVANVEAPFNLQETARVAAGFIANLNIAATNLNAAINDVRRLVLNERTLTNLAHTIDTLDQVSENAITVENTLNALIATNAVPAGMAVSNLLMFTERLNDFAQSAQNILNTNEPQITAAVSNLQASSAMLTNLISEAQRGQGLLGTLINNQQLASNVTALASNLAISSSNLKTNGLWHFLWKPKPSEAGEPPAPKKTK